MIQGPTQEDPREDSTQHRHAPLPQLQHPLSNSGLLLLEPGKKFSIIVAQKFQSWVGAVGHRLV
jgi:hypothetical protein